MDKNGIDRLFEIKELYELGILTKEEMEAEKAKILRPSSVPKVELKKQRETGTPEVDKTVLERECEAPAEETTETDTKAETETRQSPTDSSRQDEQDEPVIEHQTTEQGKDNDVSAIGIIFWGFSIGILIIILIILLAFHGKSSNNSDYHSYAEEYVGDYNYSNNDGRESVVKGILQDDNTYVSYEEKADKYIAGLRYDTKVVAIFADADRHCVYTLIDSDASWGIVKNLYCHDLVSDSTVLVNVPYQVGGYDVNELSDAKLVGYNLYVINTSYRCGERVACLNTLTDEWSCVINECSYAKFTGSNELEYTIATLIYEGQCLADNVYSYETKTLTL